MMLWRLGRGVSDPFNSKQTWRGSKGKKEGLNHPPRAESRVVGRYLSDVSEHVVPNAPPHGDGLAVLVLDPGRAAVACDARHLSPEVFV